MANRIRTLSQYTFQNQREGVGLFLGDRLPVATNDLQLAAFTLNGKIRDVHRFSRRDAALIEPANGGLPKLFIATAHDRKLTRTIFKHVFENQLGISLENAVFDVDHVLPQVAGLGTFVYTLVNPENQAVNRSFGGGLDKSSKASRRFEDPVMEKASITEFVKMQGLAPMLPGNLARDCLIAVLNARESGILSRAQASRMWNTIKHSNNNLVRDAFENEPDLEAEAKRLELIPGDK
jgi:hypothetical protein